MQRFADPVWLRLRNPHERVLGGAAALGRLTPAGAPRSAGRKRRDLSDWRLVERRQPVIRVGDDFAQDRFHPRIFREPQRDPKPNDPRPKPSGFVFR
jgi:hypothetical protein